MNREVTVDELAKLVGGRVLRGDGQRTVRRVLPAEAAGDDAVTFVTKPRYIKHLGNPAAVLTSGRFAEKVPGSLTVIEVRDPYLAFALAAQHFAEPVPAPEGQHPSAVIDPTAEIGAGVVMAAHVVIGPRAKVGNDCVLHAGVHIEADASVGEGSVLYNHVVIRHGCDVGARCILHPGVVIGADGFGFAKDSQPQTSTHVKIPQTGNVVVEDDVEIGANSCVDRAALGSTRIGAGSKIDNLVQIGHNVVVGPGCILVAQSGVAGSSVLGREVILGAQAGVSGHVQLGDDVMVLGQSGVTQNLADKERVAGTPSMPATTYMRAAKRLESLDELFHRVKELEKKLEGGSE